MARQPRPQTRDQSAHGLWGAIAILMGGWCRGGIRLTLIPTPCQRRLQILRFQIQRTAPFSQGINATVIRLQRLPNLRRCHRQNLLRLQRGANIIDNIVQ